MHSVWPPPPTSTPPAPAEPSPSPSLVPPTLLYALVWSFSYVLFLALGEGFHNTTFNGFNEPLRASPGLLLAYLAVTFIPGTLFGYNHVRSLADGLKRHPVQGGALVWRSVGVGATSGPVQVLLLSVGDLFNPLHLYPVTPGCLQALDASKLAPFALATVMLALSGGYVVGREWPRLMGRPG